jgi:hypothetical protein
MGISRRQPDRDLGCPLCPQLESEPVEKYRQIQMVPCRLRGELGGPLEALNGLALLTLELRKELAESSVVPCFIGLVVYGGAQERHGGIVLPRIEGGTPPVVGV